MINAGMEYKLTIIKTPTMLGDISGWIFRVELNWKGCGKGSSPRTHWIEGVEFHVMDQFLTMLCKLFIGKLHFLFRTSLFCRLSQETFHIQLLPEHSAPQKKKKLINNIPFIMLKMCTRKDKSTTEDYPCLTRVDNTK